MNTRLLTSSVVIFVSLMTAHLGMAGFGLRLPDPQAGPALILAGAAIATAALADSLPAWAPSSAGHRAPSSASR